MRLALIGATAAAVALSSASATAQSVAIGTNPQGSLSYAIGAGVAKAITKHSSLTVRPVGFGGGTVFMPRINTGALEFGTDSVMATVFAFRGTGISKGKPHPNLRVVARLVRFYSGMMVRNDSGIKSVNQLRGRPFPTEFTRQRIVMYTTKAMLATGGLTFADIKPVPVANFARGVRLLVTGKVDGADGAPGSGIIREANSRRALKFISLDPTPANVKILNTILPGAHFAELKPSKRLPTVREKVTLFSFPYLLIAGKHVADQTVYKTVKALHGAKKALVASHGIFHSFSPQKMAVHVPGVGYHPGAIKFYKEMGTWPPKKN